VAVTIMAGLIAVAAMIAQIAGAAAGWAADVSWTAAGVSALAGALTAALQQPRGSRMRGAWLLFAAGSACWLTGAVIRDVQGTGLLTAPVAMAWMGFAVLCIAAFARRLPRLYVFAVFLLDAIPVALLIVALARAAAPAPSTASVSYRLFLRLFPALYVLLAAHAIQMAGLYRIARVLPASIVLFTSGFGFMALAGLFWAPGQLAGDTPQSQWSAPLWSLGLLALAAAGLIRARRSSRVPALPPAEWQHGPHALPPAAAVLALIILLPFARPQDRLVLQAFLLAAAVALFVRVYLMRREDVRLLAELVRSRHEAEQAAARAGQSAQRLRLLADATPRLRSLVLDELLQAVCDAGREVVGARFAAFGLASGGDGLVRLATSGLDETARGRVSAALRRGGGPLAAVLWPGAPATSGTIAGASAAGGRAAAWQVPLGPPPGHPFAGPVLSVPVPLDSQRRGALFLAGKEGGFGGDDETLAALLASNVGRAIANAWLYAESQAQEEQLAVQNERLRDLDRLKDEFVALVSHELRTPLTSIIGYLELVQEQEQAGLAADQRTFTDVIARNASRLLRLVGDLLFLSGIQAGALNLDFDETDLTDVIENAVEETRPAAAAKRITLTLTAGPVPRLRADGTRLAQLVANLMSNAVKFTPEEGSVTVTVKPEGGSAVIIIADTGIGISADDKRHVFERFYRAPSVTDRAIQGTGLGLTISKAIVEAHDGSISVDSDPGRGTTVMVRIPLRPAAGRAVPTPNAASGLALRGIGGSRRPAARDARQDLVDGLRHLLLPSRHVLLGEVLQHAEDPVLAVQYVDLLLAHLVQRDERLVVGDGPLVTRRLRPVGADLERDHDRELGQVEDGEQQRPGRLVETDDVAEEQPDHDPGRDAEEHPHRAAEPVDHIGDLVEHPLAPDVAGHDQLGLVLRRCLANLGRTLRQVRDGPGVLPRRRRCGQPPSAAWDPWFGGPGGGLCHGNLPYWRWHPPDNRARRRTRP
jgi:signal transduction histidine kinase